MNDQEHMALAEEQLRLLLELSGEVLPLRISVQQMTDRVFISGAITDTLRNRVLIGLSLKALDSFERLVVDAREKRSECSHHLKTMVESFIYCHWVGDDPTEHRAKLLYADGCRARAVYHENCSDSESDKESAAAWKELQRAQVLGMETEWRAFKDAGIGGLAVEARIAESYHKIYRMACEAAHMGDLCVYMPPQPQEVGITFSDLSMLRSYVSLRFGIHLACDLLQDASCTRHGNSREA